MAKNQRDPAKESLWRETLNRQASSGLTVREFCEREQLTESSFYAWRRTIGERDGKGKPPAFVPAVVRGEAGHEAPLALKLPSGLELRLSPAIPAERLADLVRALEARGAR